MAEVPHVLAGLDGLRQLIGTRLAERATASGQPLRGSVVRILHLIGPHGTRPTELADGAWITKQAIGKRIRELEERGLVTVEPDPADGRAVLVRRTGDGDRLLRFSVRQIAEVERELADAVGPERYAEFRAVLDELAADHQSPLVANAGRSGG